MSLNRAHGVLSTTLSEIKTQFLKDRCLPIFPDAFTL